eukprot:6210168-Pleurochrysis_carterae.AAC.2
MEKYRSRDGTERRTRRKHACPVKRTRSGQLYKQAETLACGEQCECGWACILRQKRLMICVRVHICCTCANGSAGAHKGMHTGPRA